MKAGFTLAELLIVIAILSLLMVSISPFMRGNQDQALLSRQTDIVRQGFYETVMRAKTGAAELDLPDAAQPLRGFLMSQSSQEIRPMVWPKLSLSDAKTQSLSALRTSGTSSVNLLHSDVGQEAKKPLATIQSIKTKNGAPQQILILMESVSNDMVLLTDQGTISPATLSLTLSLPDNPRITREVTIHPLTGITNVNE